MLVSAHAAGRFTRMPTGLNVVTVVEADLMHTWSIEARLCRKGTMHCAALTVSSLTCCCSHCPLVATPDQSPGNLSGMQTGSADERKVAVHILLRHPIVPLPLALRLPP